jgi:hypothetical protein
MLNVYYGANLSTAVTASGVMANLDEIQHPHVPDTDPFNGKMGVMYVPF